MRALVKPEIDAENLARAYQPCDRLAEKRTEESDPGALSSLNITGRRPAST